MIFDHNVTVTKTLDFGQIQELVAQVESNELQQCRRALQKKTDELNMILRQKEDSANGPSYCVQNIHPDVEVTEAQSQDMQKATDELCIERERLLFAGEDFAAHRLELRGRLEAESSQRCLAQSNLDYARARLSNLASELEQRANRARDQQAQWKAEVLAPWGPSQSPVPCRPASQAPVRPRPVSPKTTAMPKAASLAESAESSNSSSRSDSDSGIEAADKLSSTTSELSDCGVKSVLDTFDVFDVEAKSTFDAVLQSQKTLVQRTLN